VIAWKNESAFQLSLDLPSGMTAKVDLPATDGSTGVLRDGKPVPAVRNGDRWIVKDEVIGSVTLQIN